jgi:hypothetical protein
MESPSAIVSSDPGDFLSVINAAIDNPTEVAAPVETPAAQEDVSPALDLKPSTPKESKSTETKKGADALLGDEESTEEAAETDEADDTPDEIKEDKKAAYKWGELRAEAKQAKVLAKEVEQLRQQLAEKEKLRDADPLKQEAEELRKKYEDLEKEAYVWKIEKTSAWKNEVEKPIAAIRESIENIAKEYEVSEELLFEAFADGNMKSRAAKFDQIFEHLPRIVQNELSRLDSEATAVSRRKAELESNAEQAYKELTQRETETTEKQKLESKAAQLRAIEADMAKIKKVAANFVHDDTPPENVIREIEQEVGATSFEDMTTEEKAWAAIASVALPKMNKAVVELRKQIAGYKKEIAQMTNSRPGGSASASNSAKGQPDGKGFLEAIGIA